MRFPSVVAISFFLPCAAFAFSPSTRIFSNSKAPTTAIHQSSISLPTPPPVVTKDTGVSSSTTSKTSNNVDAALQENLSDDPPSMAVLRKMMPAATWQIDTKTSLFYFGVDFAAVAASMGFLNQVVTSDVYHNLPWYAQAATVAPLQVLTGFAMWCMWCIGHDAGHNTITRNKQYGKQLTRLVGEVAHSAICLTPFVPWALSHRKHHLHHNHLERDYSHQWFIRQQAESLHPLIKASYWTRNVQLPILYFVYLFTGVPDGGHVFFYGRMWEGHSLKEKLDGAWSVAVSMATAGTLWYNLGTADFTVVCMVPWLVMSFWLFMVTYLQHHSDDGKLYTDDTYTFVKGAFETVDRNYGLWTNRLSHHMMDGHVVHHLFYNKVPHYRLEQATEALQKGLQERGQAHLYKRVETLDYTQEIIKQFDENWFFINEEQVVR